MIYLTFLGGVLVGVVLTISFLIFISTDNSGSFGAWFDGK